MSKEHEHGNLLVEPVTLENGKVLSVTEAPNDEVHIDVDEFRITLPRFGVKDNGKGDFSAGLVKTAQQLERLLGR